MKIFSFNSDIRKQPPKGVFIEAIWKSRDGQLGVSITIGISIGINMAKKLFLCSEFFFFLFFEKIKYLCSFICLVMASVPLCYKYLFLYDFQFIHSKASIGVLKKGFLNFRKHQFIGVLKK